MGTGVHVKSRLTLGVRDNSQQVEVNPVESCSCDCKCFDFPRCCAGLICKIRDSVFKLGKITYIKKEVVIVFDDIMGVWEGITVSFGCGTIEGFLPIDRQKRSWNAEAVVGDSGH